LVEESGREPVRVAEGETRVNAQAKGPVLDKPSKRETNTEEAIRKENLSGKQTKALNFFKRLFL